MPPLLSTQETIKEKVDAQKEPKVFFADVDGTLFSPNQNILTAPFYNRKTAAYLKQNNIPVILVTGRSDWGSIDKTQLELLGFHPDCIITANGTVIYQQLTNHIYSRDMEWEAVMQYSKVKRPDGKVESWNKSEITSVIKEYLLTQDHPFTLGTGNTFLIRIKFITIPLTHLEKIRKDILTLFPSGLRVIYTEKLLRKNTLSIFSGEILITPKFGGKDNAVTYILEKYAKQTQKVLHAFLFGDATVDIPMLTLKEKPQYYSLSQFLVHPTPLAKKSAETAQQTNPHLHILLGDGPKEILKIVKEELSVKRQPLTFPRLLEEGQAEVVSKHEPSAIARTPALQKIKQSQQYNNIPIKLPTLSPAQNNPIRQLITYAEPLLDRLVDKNLSPNEVSFLGLTKLQEGLTQLYSEKSSILKKLNGLYKYGFGNLTDVLDGVRARRSDKKTENGQLVDGFSDRTKEFMQLFIRGKKRMQTNEPLAVQTFLTALCCALPSIARAQVEIAGKTVQERDEKGGSMIDRTRKLFSSIILDTIGVRTQSEAIDQQIYSSSIATFQNRLNAISNKDERSPLFIARREITKEPISDFQKKALERWLLYIDILQQEDAIIKKYLSKQTQLLKAYEKESQKLAKNYLTLKINELRKKWEIKDYKLRIKDYIT